MDVSAVRARTPAGPEPAPPAADTVAREFEAMVVARMMESMFTGLDADTPFGGGEAAKPWRSFLLQEYGKAIAEAGTLGIGDLLREEVARLYAAQQEGAP